MNSHGDSGLEGKELGMFTAANVLLSAIYCMRENCYHLWGPHSWLPSQPVGITWWWKTHHFRPGGFRLLGVLNMTALYPANLFCFMKGGQYSMYVLFFLQANIFNWPWVWFQPLYSTKSILWPVMIIDTKERYQQMYIDLLLPEYFGLRINRVILFCIIVVNAICYI